MLGKDYEEWVKNGCPVPGWTPFGKVQKALETLEKSLETAIQTQQLVSTEILENLSVCKFNLGTRAEAEELHRHKKLVPKIFDICVWTDWSLYRKLSPDDQPVDSGAAAIIYFSEPDRDHEIVKYKITNAISSYEADIVALQAGLNKIWDLESTSQNIHVCTDSMS